MASSKDARAEKRKRAELHETAAWLQRDARRILRKRGDKIAEIVREEVETAANRLAHLVGRPDAPLTDLEAAATALDQLLDRHLARFRKSATREYVEAVGGAVLLALLIRAFVFEAFKIPTGSMIPTLHVHDHLFVNKFIYGLKIPFTRVRLFGYRTPRRGEIVVFEYPYDGDPESSGKDLIKRVIGTPGDLVRLQDNRIFINGEPLATRLVEAKGDCGEAIELLRPCPDGSSDICLFDGAASPHIHSRYPNLEEAQRAFAELEGFACRKTRECSGDIAWTSQVRVALAQADRRFAYPVNDPSWPPEGFDRLRFEEPARRYLPPENKDHPAFRVPEGHLLVMGDNRDNSKDGRYFGLVPFDTVKGKAGFIWFAYERDFYKPDWSRIGRVVHEDADVEGCK